jgi:hypothetical protein
MSRERLEGKLICFLGFNEHKCHLLPVNLISRVAARDSFSIKTLEGGDLHFVSSPLQSTDNTCLPQTDKDEQAGKIPDTTSARTTTVFTTRITVVQRGKRVADRACTGVSPVCQPFERKKLRHA